MNCISFGLKLQSHTWDQQVKSEGKESPQASTKVKLSLPIWAWVWSNLPAHKFKAVWGLDEDSGGLKSQFWKTTSSPQPLISTPNGL